MHLRQGSSQLEKGLKKGLGVIGRVISSPQNNQKEVPSDSPMDEWDRGEVIAWLSDLRGLGRERESILEYFRYEDHDIEGDDLIEETENGQSDEWLRVSVGIKDSMCRRKILKGIKKQLKRGPSANDGNQPPPPAGPRPQGPRAPAPVGGGGGSFGDPPPHVDALNVPQDQPPEEEVITWTCRKCSQINSERLPKCQICQDPKPVQSDTAPLFQDWTLYKLERFCGDFCVDIKHINEQFSGNYDAIDEEAEQKQKTDLLRGELSRYTHANQDGSEKVFEEIGQYKEEFSEWRKNVQHLCSGVDEKDSAVIVPRCIKELGLNSIMGRLKRKSDDESLRVFVFGIVNSGKSTLMNLLLDDDDMDPFPADAKQGLTRAMCEVYYAEKLKVEVFFENEEEKSFELDDKKEAKELIAKYGSRTDEKDEFTVTKLRIGWPAAILKCGITLVDSPGLAEAKLLKEDPQRQEKYDKWLKNIKTNISSSMASICVQGIDNYNDLTLKTFEEIKASKENMLDASSLFFVITKADEKSLNDRKKLIQPFQQAIEKTFNEHGKIIDLDTNFITVNLKCAKLVRTQGLVSPDHKQLLGSLSNWFRKVVVKYAVAFWRVKQQCLEEIRSLICLKIGGLLMDDDKLKQIRKKAKQTLNRLKNELKPLDEQYNKQYEIHVEGLVKVLQAVLSPKSERIIKRIATGALEKLPQQNTLWRMTVNDVGKGVLLAEIPDEWVYACVLVQKMLETQSEIIYKGVIEELWRERNDLLASVSADSVPVSAVETVGNVAALVFGIPLGIAGAGIILALGVGAIVLAIPAGIIVGIPLGIIRRDWNASDKCRQFAKEYFNKTISSEKSLREIYKPALDEVHAPLKKGIEATIATMERSLKLLVSVDEGNKKVLLNQCRHAKRALEAFILDDLYKLFVKQCFVGEMPKNYTGELGRCIEEIGRGSFGVVERYMLKMGPDDTHAEEYEREVAVKSFGVSEYRQQVMEFECLKRLKDNPCAHVIDYIGSVVRDGKLSIVMEYFGISLDKWIQQHEGKEPDVAEIKQIALGISLGIAHMHKLNITHRDIKPANILISPDTNEVKIVDFGTSVESSELGFTIIGTPAYMAPEIFDDNSRYGSKCDIYSFGLVLWELYYRREIFAGMAIYDLRDLVVAKNERPQFDKHIPPKLRKVIDECWRKDPDQRPDWPQILADLTEL